MAKDSASEAPQEMVNIRLPAPKGGQGEELPLRLAIVGDFTGADDETEVKDRDMLNINKKNFNDTLASMNVAVSMTVKNTISGGQDEVIPVDLKFKKRKDFRPEEVAKQVPQIGELVALRKRLVELRSWAAKDPKKMKEFNKILAQLFE